MCSWVQQVRLFRTVKMMWTVASCGKVKCFAVSGNPGYCPNNPGAFTFSYLVTILTTDNGKWFQFEVVDLSAASASIFIVFGYQQQSVKWNNRLGMIVVSPVNLWATLLATWFVWANSWPHNERWSVHEKFRVKHVVSDYILSTSLVNKVSLRIPSTLSACQRTLFHLLGLSPMP